MYCWLIVILLLGIIEIFTADLVTIWFIVSALIALIASIFTDSFLIEFSIFVVLGILFMVITKPLLKKSKIKNNIKTNIDRIIGMTGVVTEEIKKGSIGEVKVDGKTWSAYADEDILVGSIVEILSIDSVKLKVKRGDE